MEGERSKEVCMHGSWLITPDTNSSNQMSHVLWVLSLPEGQKNWQNVWKRGQRTDYIATHFHFQPSFL